jgi:aminopeptidase N
LKLALKDKFWGLRSYTIDKLDFKKANVKAEVESTLADIAAKDPKPTVRAAAIGLLGQYGKETYKPLFTKAINDSSYSIAGEALSALAQLDGDAALAAAKGFSKQPMKGKLASSVSQLLIEGGTEEDFDVIAGNFNKLPVSDSKFEALQPFADYLAKLGNTQKVKKGIDMIVEFREAIPAAYKNQTSPFINNIILTGIMTKKNAAKDNAAFQEQATYIKSKIEDKKAF